MSYQGPGSGSFAFPLTTRGQSPNPEQVPVAYLALLLHCRKALLSLQPTRLSTALEFLHSNYQPEFFWWELVICMEKLVLTSAMIVVLPGTLVQVVVGLVIKLGVQTFTNIANPYVLESNDVLKVNMAIMVIRIRTLINIRFGFACNLLDVLIAQIFEDIFEGVFDGDNFFCFGHDLL